ncbi:MAG: SDR family oxidoreductase, partial [Verrucomicrobiota bacterium]
GRSIVKRLFIEGADRVVVAAEESEPFEWEELKALGADYLIADLGTSDEPGQTVRDAQSLMVGLDGLVHCAGVYPEGNPSGKSELQLWEETMNIKARAGYLLAAEFVKVAEEGASFVAVTSINAEQSEPDHLAYDPACAALGGVVRAFAIQYAPRYRFNAVAPGLIRTRLTESVVDSGDLHQFACDNIPMNRLGRPGECAGAAMFLLSDDAAYITGETIFVDGGIKANQMSKPPGVE